MNPNTAGTITYGTTGTSPNRKFIVSFNGVPDFGTSNYETGQMVISETTGEIVFHITTAQPSLHTIGVQNATATIAATVPGQNNTSTAISNTSWSLVWPQTTSYTWTPSTDLSSTTIPNPVSSTSTTVTYTVTGVYNGCTTSVSAMVSVNPSPAAITGTFSSCVGGTSALVNTTPSGVWTSSDGAVASVSAGGVVTANTVGTAIISYTANSCSSTIIFTVNSAPGAITGPASVCNGLTATLANPGGIGSWTSGNTGVATVGATSGIVTGLSVGTTLISYINGCGTYVTRVTSVIASPAVISGPVGICLGSTATLSNAIAGGTWSSGNTAVATVNSATGVVSTVTTGFAAISYNLGNGCPVATQTETISNTTPPLSLSVSATNFCAPGLSNMTASSNVTNYSVNAAVYAPVSFTPTGTFAAGSLPSSGGTSLDDAYFTIAIPFDLKLYGTTYPAGTNAYISTNGHLSFGTGITTTYIYTIPNTGVPYADIALFGRDMNLNTSGTITYGTTGTAPNRQFIVSYNAVPDFGSTTLLETGQMVLSESTGEIVFHVATAQASTHTIGVQNAGATTAAAVPGHNNTLTAISNSSWSFQWPVATSYTWSPATYLSATTGANVTASGVTSTTTYTVSALYYGCATTMTTTLTVNTTPTAISGNAAICETNNLTLGNGVSGGTWTSGNTSVATIDPSTGVVAGVDDGTATVSYTITSSGCRVTDIVTVNAMPGDITGTASVCIASTTSLASTTSGGTWSSTVPTVATIGSTGVVSGEGAGLSTISYMLSTGCFKTRQVTVNPLPVVNIAPASAATICEGQSTSFTASSPLIEFPLLSQDFNGTLGSWTIDNLFGDPANVWQITSASFSGVAGDGTPMLESAPSAGSTSAVHTILTSPSFSTVGFGTVTLSFNQDLTSYSIVDNTVAVEYSIDNGSTWNILSNQLDVVDNPGTWTASAPQVTVGLPTAALNVPSVMLRWNYDSYGVYWNIDNISVKGALPAATFTWAGSGSATEVSCPGCATTSITPTVVGANVYSVTASSTCSTTSTVTVSVNPLPSITGASSVLCTGKTITLGTDITGGAWISGDNTKATVDPSTGVVTGVGTGTVVITYSAPTTCVRTVTLNVNQSPSTITGALHVCETLTTALGNFVGGGTWSSTDETVATVNITSGLTTGLLAGNSVISYILPSGCFVTANATVDPTPTAFSGSLEVCEGSVTTLGSTPTGGTWVSSSTANADVDMATGAVSGHLQGNTTIVYTLSTGCERSEEVTVNALPANITGPMAVCEGLTTTLANTTGSGTWSSSDLAVGTVDAAGVVSGLTFGTTMISYTITSTGCYKTTEVTVNALPGMIGGSMVVCEGLSTTLSNTPTGGTWISSNTATATIDLTSGVMTGGAFGTTNITYTLSTGCLRSAEATVNPLPVDITGSLEVCQGLTTNLINMTPDGTWSSDDLSIAGIDATGMVTGNLAGTANIFYTLTATGCLKSVIVTVNPLPSTIGGSLAVCEGLTTGLTNTASGGIWTSSDTLIADVDSVSGMMSGIAMGTATITYTLGTGCMKVGEATVNPLPDVITGTAAVCKGLTTTLANTTLSGTWSNDASGAATVDAAGVVTGVVAGLSSISYTITSTGCLRAVEVTVNALPEVYAVTGGGGYCLTTAGIAVGLANSETGVNYDLYQGTSLMGSASGTAGSAVSFGLQSVVGTYTVFATNTATGCVNDMAGSAIVSTMPLNIPAVALSTAATTVCSGIPITYTATPVNGGTLPVYSWEINGGVIPGATSATYAYAPTNGDIVKVTLNSNEICAIPSTATDVLTMTVNPSEMPVATISVPNTTVCAGSGATFSVAPTFGGTTPTYKWFVNGLATGGTGLSYTYVPANGDVVTCKMSSNFTCRLADTVTSNSLTITTTPISLPIVSLSVSPSSVFTSGTSVTFSATVAGIGSATPSYQWLVNGVAQSATGSTFTSSTLHNNDSVTCKVNVSLPCGFENFNSIVVRVKTVGVSQVFGQGNIMLVPNPNQGEFVVKGTLATETDEDVFVEVLDMLGQIVYKGHTVTKNGALNEKIKLSNTLANGMYMLNLRTATEAAVFHFVLEQ
jgi:rRNA maturation protein Nop10